MIALGNRPEPLSVYLVRDVSFVAALEVTPGPWPAGTSITLEFRATPGDTTPTLWPATITGAFARWERPDSEVNDVLDEGLEHVRLIYREADGTELAWAVGTVLS